MNIEEITFINIEIRDLNYEHRWPQGCVLSLVLFTLYTNDIRLMVTHAW